MKLIEAEIKPNTNWNPEHECEFDEPKESL